jgi:Trk K+ transport system NAD-binding subunit
MFRRQSVVSAYHHALGTSTGRHLYRDRLKVRTQPGAMFFEVPISKDCTAEGTLVKNIEWPDGAILVSIRRGSRVLIPHGDTTLEAADILTAFGTGEAREKIAFLVEPVSDPIDT